MWTMMSGQRFDFGLREPFQKLSIKSPRFAQRFTVNPPWTLCEPSVHPIPETLSETLVNLQEEFMQWHMKGSQRAHMQGVSKVHERNMKGSWRVHGRFIPVYEFDPHKEYKGRSNRFLCGSGSICCFYTGLSLTSRGESVRLKKSQKHSKLL